ncbi:TetR family transcriptional regulator [Mycoplasmatota bacterium zrk1]
MARRKEFSKKDILGAAFEIACRDGLEGTSMRKIATLLGSSVAPLYISYTNREELIKEIVAKAHNEVFKFQEEKISANSYYQRGESLLLVAKKYPKLFVDVISYDSKNEPDQKLIGTLLSIMRKDDKLCNFSDNQLLRIHSKIDLFIFGVISALYSGLLPSDATDKYLLELIRTTQDDIVTGEIKRNSL